MKWTISLMLFTLLLSCSVPKSKEIREVDELYTQAFCALIKAKQKYRTPELRDDSIRVFDHYYIDSTSLYYNLTNLGLELSFVDTINFPQHKGEKNEWKMFQNFNSLMGNKYSHQIDNKCLEGEKIKFIGKEDLADQFQEHNTLLYSPLIKFKKNSYKIYEKRFGRSSFH